MADQTSSHPTQPEDFVSGLFLTCSHLSNLTCTISGLDARTNRADRNIAAWAQFVSGAKIHWPAVESQRRRPRRWAKSGVPPRVFGSSTGTALEPAAETAALRCEWHIRLLYLSHSLNQVYFRFVF